MTIAMGMSVARSARARGGGIAKEGILGWVDGHRDSTSRLSSMGRRDLVSSGDSSSLGSTPSSSSSVSTIGQSISHWRSRSSGQRTRAHATRGVASSTHFCRLTHARTLAHALMRPPSPSIPEKDFFFAALDQNLRLDGREFLEARPHSLSFGAELGHVECSLGKTRYARTLTASRATATSYYAYFIECWRK
jgi:hypothetical protein